MTKINYDDYEALIHERAYSFSRTTNHHVSDLVSEANMAFLRAQEAYDPSKGVKFSSYLHRAITFALISYTKSHDVPLPHEHENDERNHEKGPSADRHLLFRDALASLGDEARYVASIFLCAPAEILSLSGGESFWTMRGRLMHHLRKEKGWSYARAYRAYDDIKDALKEMP